MNHEFWLVQFEKYEIFMDQKRLSPNNTGYLENKLLLISINSTPQNQQNQQNLKKMVRIPKFFQVVGHPHKETKYAGASAEPFRKK